MSASGALERLGAELAARIDRPLKAIGDPDAWSDSTDWRDALQSSDATLRRAASELDLVLAAGATPVMLASRCAIALSTVPVVVDRNPDAVVLWFDAHGDLNTPATSPTGYLGGMCLSAVLGEWDSGHGAGLDPANVALIGARDLDPPEVDLIEQHRIVEFPVDARDLAGGVASFVGQRPFYVHLDLDCLDPTVASAEYRVPGGLTLDALVDVLRTASIDGRPVGVEIAEFEPRRDGDLTRCADLIARCLAALWSGVIVGETPPS